MKHQKPKQQQAASSVRQFGLEPAQVVERIEPPKPRRYTPPKCSICTAIRPEGQDFTEVYSVKREGEYTIRYCRCNFCRNTFKDSQRG